MKWTLRCFPILKLCPQNEKRMNVSSIAVASVCVCVCVCVCVMHDMIHVWFLLGNCLYYIQSYMNITQCHVYGSIYYCTVSQLTVTEDLCPRPTLTVWLLPSNSHHSHRLESSPALVPSLPSSWSERPL